MLARYLRMYLRSVRQSLLYKAAVMNPFLAVLLLLIFPATAFAVFFAVPAPEPGVLELVALGVVVLVAVRLLRRKK